MIIEASFFKLFSYVSAVDKFQKETQFVKAKESPKFSKERNIYESQIVGMFADIIKSELRSLGIFVPARFVIQEYPYPSDSSKQVDIFVNLDVNVKI